MQFRIPANFEINCYLCGKGAFIMISFAEKLELYNYVMRLDFFASRYRLQRDRLYWAILRYGDRLYPVIGVRRSLFYIAFLRDSVCPLEGTTLDSDVDMIYGIKTRVYKRHRTSDETEPELEPVARLVPASTYKTEQGFVMKAGDCRVTVPVDAVHRFWQGQYVLDGIDMPEVQVTWPARPEEIPDCVMNLNFFSWRYGFPLDGICWAIVYSKNEDGAEDVDATLWYRKGDLFVLLHQGYFLKPFNSAGCVTLLEKATMKPTAEGYVFKSRNHRHVIPRDVIAKTYAECFYFTFYDKPPKRK